MLFSSPLQEGEVLQRKEMEIVDIIKDWANLVILVLTGIVWWFVKINSDKIKAIESAKQEVQHTHQEKLITEEKDFELDSRRVKVSEEVASETLEHLAETREENLKLLEDNYELRKAVVDLQYKFKGLETEIVGIRDDKKVLGYFFCGNIDCKVREPQLGTLHLNCISLEAFKELMNKGKEDK